jgi:hypothetical protein
MTDTTPTQAIPKQTPATQPSNHDAIYIGFATDSVNSSEEKREAARLRAEKSAAATKAETAVTKKTLKAQKARSNAIQRLQSSTAGKPVSTSPTLEALRSVASTLGLPKADADKAAELLNDPSKAAEALQKAQSMDLPAKLTSGDKELLVNVLTALKNGSATDVLKAIGITSSEAKELLNLIQTAPTPANNSGKDFLSAIAAADASLSDVITAISKNQNSLVELHEEAQSVSAKNLDDQLNYIEGQLHHELHEIRRQHRLSIVKKIFGGLAAAILILVGLVAQRPSIVMIGILVAITTAKPDLISNAINNLCRDMHLKGAGAEAMAIYLKAMIATLIAVCSAGTGLAGACTFIGTAAGTFAMEGGVENIAFLEGDLKQGGDLRESDPDSDAVKKYEKIGNYATLGVSLGFGLAAIGTELPQILSSASRLASSALETVKKLFSSFLTGDGTSSLEEAAQNTNSAAQAVEAAESTQTASNASADSAKSSTQSAFKKAVAFMKENVETIQNLTQSTQSGGQSTASILIGISMLALAGFERNLGISQGNLNQQESSMQSETESFRKDMTSVKATTTQAIDQLMTETNTEQRAYSEQIVGNVS